MKLHHILIASLAMPVMLHAADPQEGTGGANGYGNDDPYVLVWQDLFDADELDPLRWNIEVNGAGGGNNELQYYTDRADNVRLGDDGEGNHCLILTARREEYKNRHFTSGRINSLGLTAFLHGKIEAAIKLPSTANGLWPAFWMMGNDYGEVGWPKCGETDIMEFGNGNGINAGTQDRYFNGACHWGQGWPAASYAKSTTRSYSLQDGEFHIFTCIWTPNEVRMYVDLDRMPVQTPYFKMNIAKGDPNDEWSAGNYFHKLNFILFNLAVGGDFTGIHNPDNITALNDDNDQQASMYVNYVKVYQLGTDDEDLYTVVPSDPITGSIADITTGGALRIANGMAYAAAPITVYDISGAVCLRSDEGILPLDSLRAGIYFVHSDNYTLKLAK